MPSRLGATYLRSDLSRTREENGAAGGFGREGDGRQSRFRAVKRLTALLAI